MSADPVLGLASAATPVTIAVTEPTVLTARFLDHSNQIALAAQREPERTGSAAAEQTPARHEVVFVDTRVDGYQQFLEDFLSQTSGERRIEARLLDAERDGIEQISQALAGYSDLDAVHFLSHGADGAVQLGATWLDRNALQAMAGSIAQWSASLSADADLLFYGCDLAASPVGIAFVEQLSLLTGADVAASVDRTGSTLLGGDWDLEFAIGTVDTAVAVAPGSQQSWSGILAAPTASNMNAAETYTLDTPLDLADIVINDVDSANVTASLILSDSAAGSLSTATSGSVTSTYNTGTGAWSASGAIADVNALLANLTYTPSLLYLFPFTIATSVDDGVATITGSKSMTMGLLNFAPNATNLNAGQTFTEDTPLNLTNIVISDIDSPNATATLTLSNTAAGSLSTGSSGEVTSTYNAATGVWSASGAIADVNTLLAGLTFTPELNYNSNFTIATRVDDGVAPAITGTKAMTGIAVNDAPTASNLSAPETFTEDTPLNLTNIVVSEVDSATVTATLTLSAPAAGSLNTATSGAVTSTYNAGTGVWSASGAIANVNTLLAGLTFTPALNYNSNFTIATSVNDGVAAPITGTKAMTGIAVNDAPVNSVPSFQATAQDTPLTFDTSNGNSISLSDVDASSSQVELMLAVTNGTATLHWPSTTANAAGGEFRANTTTSDIQATLNSSFYGGGTTDDFSGPRAVAADASGNFVVTWSSRNQAGSGWGVHAQRFNAAGVAQGGEFQVYTTVADHHVDASVAMDDSGNFVIVWASVAGASDNWGIFAQRFNAAGVAQGAELHVNTYLNKEQLGPSVAMDSNGDFVITWSSKDQDGDKWGVYAKRFNANGVVQGGEFRVNTSTIKEQTASSVAMDADGNFVVTWSSKDQDGDSWGVYAKRYNADGLVQGGEFRVNTTTVRDQVFSSVAMDADGNFVVTWSSKDQDGDSWGVYGQRYNGGGLAQGTAFQVNQTTAKEQMHSSVSMDVDGDFIITWSSKDQDGSGWGIYARQFNAAGAAKTGETLVNTTTAGNQEYSSVAMDARGDFVVIWSGNGPGDTTGVFGRRFSIATPLTFSAGDGTRDATMTFRGTLAEINAALDGLVFTPNVGFNGLATVTITTNDLGNSGSGGARSDTDIININVGGGNVPPTLTLTGGSLDYTENDPATVIDSAATAIDPDSADFDGGQLTVFFSAGGTDNDQLAIRNQGTAAGEIGVTGSSVTYNYGAGAVVIGTFTGGTDGLSPLIVTLNANAAATAVQALARNITYENLSDNPSTLERIAQFALTDGDGGASADASRSINLAAVNDAPLATNLNAAETYTEDTPLDLIDIVVSDDSTNVTVTLTLSAPAAGSLNTGTSGLVTSTYNAGTGVWTVTGEVADVNILLAGLTFTPAVNYNSDFTIATSVDDGLAPAITGTKNMTGTAVNDAPALVNNTLTISEGGGVVLSGSQISATDVDNAGASLTFTASGVSGGQFELVANPGVAVTNFTQGQVSGGAILFVHDGGEAAPSYNITVSDGSLSDGPAAAAITFTNQNDAPTATNLNASETYTEDTPLDLTDIVVSDVDSATVMAALTLSTPAAGSLNTGTSGTVTSTYNAVTGVWTASGAIADVNTLLAGLTFTPSLNYNSNFTIAIRVDDGVAPAITGTKAMTGIAINDAPVLVNNTLSISEGGNVVLSGSEMSATDVDNASGSLTFTASGVAGGQFELISNPSVAITSFTQAQVTGGAVRFVHDGEEAAPGYDVRVSDGSLSDGPAAAAITFTNVNDAPTASNLNAAETYTEDTPLNLTDIVVSDIDSANVTVTLTLSDSGAGSLNSATSGSVNSTYNAGTGVWTASGAIANVNTLLAGLTFTPSLNYASNFTIATSVEDGVAPAITGTKTMTGTAVNDAPTASNLNSVETYTEDTPLNLTDIVVRDIDSANVTVTLTLSESGAGSLNTGTSGSVNSTYNAGTGVWSASGAIADVNTLLAGLTFAPSLNYNNDFTIATSVDDGVAPPITGIKNMTGTAINDAPTASNINAAETYTEETPLNLTDIVVSDVDSATVTVTLTLSDSAAGSLNTATSGAVTSTYNAGTGVWSASGAITDVNALLAALTFTPSLNYNSDFTIATSVDDGIAPPLTGIKNMTANAVNDAPVLVNNTLTITEGGSVILSSSEMSASDADNATGSLTFAVSGVAGGQFELLSNPGVAISSFTQAQVTLGAVLFVHDGGELAPRYDVRVSDGSLSDGPAAAAITFTNVNDAPVLVNNRLIITEGTSVVLTSANLSAIDADNDENNLQFSISAVSGGRFELIANPGFAVTSFTQVQVLGGIVRFVHDGGSTAPHYAVSVSDGLLSAGPTPATVTFIRLDTGEPLLAPLPLPPATSAPPPPTEPPTITEPLAIIPTSTDGSGSTGVGGGDEPPSSEPESVQNEFQPAVNTSDPLDGSASTPAKMFYKPSSDLREGISTRSEAPVITPNSELEEAAIGRLSSGDLSSVIDVSGFVQGLNKLRDKVQEEAHLEKIVIGSTMTATTGFSIGYVFWLLRGEVLLTSLLASLPAWRLIDPLPVLSSLNKSANQDEDENDDSIEAAVKQSGETPPSRLAPKQQGGPRSVKWRFVMEPSEPLLEKSL